MFSAHYRPRGGVVRASAGTLEHWLTERYCLYARGPKGLYRGEIHHAPWPLQPATVEIDVNTMARATGIRLPRDPPIAHFARDLEVVAWMPERLRP